MGGSLFVFISLVSMLVYSAIENNAVPLMSKNIRVAILSNQNTVNLSGSNLKIFDFRNKKNLVQGNKNSQIELKFNSAHIEINGTKVLTQHLIIHSPEEIIRINNRPYRGLFDIYAESGGFLVVNHISLDKYLASLLNLEMNEKWPLETLKAQAVAARTYGLASMIENIDKPYDVEADVRDQVYNGSVSEAKKTLEAVKTSSGEVLAFDQMILKTYYHSNSGGQTENPSVIWGGDEKYMPSVIDPYAFNLPGYEWKLKLPVTELNNALSSFGFSYKTLFDINISKFTSTGRAEKISIVTEKNIFTLSGKEFRKLIGEMKIKSTKFIITAKSRNEIEFVGRGFGHGAGLSQWGAKKMGEEGLTYKDILKFYYPELTLKKLW